MEQKAVEIKSIEPIAVSVKEAAELIGICEKVMYQLTRRADFPRIKLGTRTIIPVEGLREWIHTNSGMVLEEQVQYEEKRSSRA